MALLSRYITRLYLRNFLLALCSFCGIYLLIEFFEKVDNFVDKNADITLYFGYFINAIPLFVNQVAPLAILMAAFTTIGTLSRNGELTAMRAGGLSLFRISRPLIITTCCITLALIASQELVLPKSVRTMNRIIEQKLKGLSQPQLIRNKIWVRSGEQIIHIEQAIPSDGSLQGITLFGLDENFQLRSRKDARSARFENGGWQFNNVIEREFDPDNGSMIDSVKTATKTLPFNRMPGDFQRPEPREWELTFSDLRKLAETMKEEGYDNTRMRVNMHAHISSPFACIVMVLLGIPFALNRGRNTSLSLGIVLSVLVGVAYFILHSVTMAFGYSGILPPLLATWSANILIGLCGTWLVLFRTQ